MTMAALKSPVYFWKIYQEQTLSRDELKSISQEQVHQMVMQIQNSTFNNPQLEKLVKKLHKQLQTVSGKKVYGYLPQDVKQTVDDILAELAKDEQVSKLYEKWCELERLKYRTYTQKEPDIPPLADNKVFKSVKNMIIRAVERLEIPAMDCSAADSSGANDTKAEIVDDSMAAHLIFNLFVCLSNCIEADYNKKSKSLRISVDSKLRRVIQQRKRDLGIHEDHGQQIL